MEQEVDLNYGRLFQIKKDFNDLQSALENITRFGLDRYDLEKVRNLKTASDHIKEVVSHPSILAAADIKTAYTQGKLNDILEFLELPSPSTNSKKAITLLESEEQDTSTSQGLPMLPKIEDPKILKVVFTHSSAANNPKYELSGSNERLEYLGDSVLSLVISTILFSKYPEYDEGLLSMLRAELVSNKNTTVWAKAYGFDKKLISGLSPLQLTNSQKKIYADTFEAYIGGLYLDSNKELTKITQWLQVLAQPVIDRFLETKLTEQHTTTALDSSIKHSKEELYTLVNPPFTPSYEVVEKLDSDHQPIFRVACVINGEVLGIANAGNKKDGGCKAAYFALMNNKLKVDKYVSLKASLRQGGAAPQPVTVPIDVQLAQGIYANDKLPY